MRIITTKQKYKIEDIYAEKTIKFKPKNHVKHKYKKNMYICKNQGK